MASTTTAQIFDVRTGRDVWVPLDATTKTLVLTHGEARWHTHHRSVFTDPLSKEPLTRGPIDLDTDLRLYWRPDQVRSVPLYGLARVMRTTSTQAGAAEFYAALMDRCIQLGSTLLRVHFRITAEMERDIDSRWARAHYDGLENQSAWVRYALTRTRAELQETIGRVKATVGLGSVNGKNKTDADRDLFRDFFRDIVTPPAPRLDCFGRLEPPESRVVMAHGRRPDGSRVYRGRYYRDEADGMGRSTSSGGNQTRFNLRPDLGTERDPVNNAGIAAFGSGAHYVCCGMPLEHPGCNIDTYSTHNDKSVPYALAVYGGGTGPYAFISALTEATPDIAERTIFDAMSARWRESYVRGTAFLLADNYARWHEGIQGLMDDLERPMARAFYTLWVSPTSGMRVYRAMGPTYLNKMVGLYLLVAEYNRWRCRGRSMDMPQRPVEWINYFDRTVFRPEDALASRGFPQIIGAAGAMPRGQFIYVPPLGGAPASRREPFDSAGDLLNIAVFSADVMGRIRPAAAAAAAAARGAAILPEVAPAELDLSRAPPLEATRTQWAAWLERVAEVIQAQPALENREALVEIVRTARTIHADRTELVRLWRSSSREEAGILAYVRLPGRVARTTQAQRDVFMGAEPEAFALVERLRVPDTPVALAMIRISNEASQTMGDSKAAMSRSRDVVLTSLRNPVTIDANLDVIRRSGVSARLDLNSFRALLKDNTPAKVFYQAIIEPQNATDIIAATSAWTDGLAASKQLAAPPPKKRKKRKKRKKPTQAQRAAIMAAEKRVMELEATREARMEAEREQQLLEAAKTREAQKDAARLLVDERREQQRLEVVKRAQDDAVAKAASDAAEKTRARLVKAVEAMAPGDVVMQKLLLNSSKANEEATEIALAPISAANERLSVFIERATPVREALSRKMGSAAQYTRQDVSGLSGNVSLGGVDYSLGGASELLRGELQKAKMASRMFTIIAEDAGTFATHLENREIDTALNFVNQDAFDAYLRQADESFTGVTVEELNDAAARASWLRTVADQRSAQAQQTIRDREVEARTLFAAGSATQLEGVETEVALRSTGEESDVLGAVKQAFLQESRAALASAEGAGSVGVVSQDVLERADFMTATAEALPFRHAAEGCRAVAEASRNAEENRLRIEAGALGAAANEIERALGDRIPDVLRDQLKDTIDEYAKFAARVRETAPTLLADAAAMRAMVEEIGRIQHVTWAIDASSGLWTPTPSNGFMTEKPRRGAAVATYKIGRAGALPQRIQGAYIYARATLGLELRKAGILQRRALAVTGELTQHLQAVSAADPVVGVPLLLGQMHGDALAAQRRLDAVLGVYGGKGDGNTQQLAELVRLCHDLNAMEADQRMRFGQLNAVTRAMVEGEARVSEPASASMPLRELQQSLSGAGGDHDAYSAAMDSAESRDAEGAKIVRDASAIYQLRRLSADATDRIADGFMGAGVRLDVVRDPEDAALTVGARAALDKCSTEVDAAERGARVRLAEAYERYRITLQRAASEARNDPTVVADSRALSAIARAEELVASAKLQNALLTVLPTLYGVNRVIEEIRGMEFFRIASSAPGTVPRTLSKINVQSEGATPPIAIVGDDDDDNDVIGPAITARYYDILVKRVAILSTPALAGLENIFAQQRAPELVAAGTANGEGALGALVAEMRNLTDYTRYVTTSMDVDAARELQRSALELYGELQHLNARREILMGRANAYFATERGQEEEAAKAEGVAPGSGGQEMAGVGAGGAWDGARFALMDRCRYVLARLDDDGGTDLVIPADKSASGAEETLALWDRTTNPHTFRYEALNAACIRPLTAVLLGDMPVDQMPFLETQIIRPGDTFALVLNPLQYALLFEGQGNPARIVGEDGSMVLQKGGIGGVPARQVILAQRVGKTANYALVTGWKSGSLSKSAAKKGPSKAQARSLLFGKGPGDPVVIRNVGRLWANWITMLMTVTRIEVASQSSAQAMYTAHPTLGRAAQAIKEALVSGKQVHGTWKGVRGVWTGKNPERDPKYIESQQLEHDKRSQVEAALIAAETKAAWARLGDHALEDAVDRARLAATLRRKAAALATVESSQFYAKHGEGGAVVFLDVDGEIQNNLLEPVTEGYRAAMIHLGADTVTRDVPGGRSSVHGKAALASLNDDALMGIGAQVFSARVGAREQANIGILLARLRLNREAMEFTSETVLSEGLSTTNRGGAQYYIGDTPVVPDQVMLLHRWGDLAGILADVLDDKPVNADAVKSMGRGWRTTTPDTAGAMIAAPISANNDDDNDGSSTIEDTEIILGGDDDDNDESLDMVSPAIVGVNDAEGLLSAIGSWMPSWPGTVDLARPTDGGAAEEEWPDME